MNYAPSTARDVIVTLPDGREAYGYHLAAHGRWYVYPNTYPCNPLDLNIWTAKPCTVVSWREIEQVYA